MTSHESIEIGQLKRMKWISSVDGAPCTGDACTVCYPEVEEEAHRGGAMGLLRRALPGPLQRLTGIATPPAPAPRRRSACSARAPSRTRRRSTTSTCFARYMARATGGRRDGDGGVVAEEDLPHLPRGRSEVGDAADAQRPRRPALLPAHRRTRGAARSTASSTPTTRTRRSPSSTRTTPTRRSRASIDAREGVHRGRTGRTRQRPLPARRRPDRHPRGA